MTTQLERIEYELRKAGFNLSEEKGNIDTLEDKRLKINDIYSKFNWNTKTRNKTTKRRKENIRKETR